MYNASDVAHIPKNKTNAHKWILKGKKTTKTWLKSSFKSPFVIQVKLMKHIVLTHIQYAFVYMTRRILLVKYICLNTKAIRYDNKTHGMWT